MSDNNSNNKKGLLVFRGDSNDLFLTGNPTITYFKCIYRRYTNFSMEIKELKFSNQVGFGLKSDLNILKSGDLLHRIFLKVKLPEFYIDKILSTDEKNKIKEIETEINKTKENYKVLKEVFKANLYAYREIINYHEIYSENIELYYDKIHIPIYNYYDKFIKPLKEYINPETISANDLIVQMLIQLNLIESYNIEHNIINGNYNDYNIVTDINTLKQKYTNFYIENTNVFIKNIVDNIKSYIDKLNDLEAPTYILTPKEVNNNMLFIIKLNERMDRILSQYLIYLEKIKSYYEIKRYKFAWVKNIGHSLIEYIEFYIGGVKIDKLDGQWIDIWHELYDDKDKEDTYKKMIGDIEDLTSFNTDIKNSYTLYIPIPFWFCKHIGLSLPLISLQYNTINIKIKFKKFNECCYTDYEITPKIETVYKSIEDFEQNDNLTLESILNNKKLNLEASILAEYIYLDSQERKLFARSSHEYLITQTQKQLIKDINKVSNNINLNFTHPSKGFIWFIQKSSQLININNSNNCNWCKYSYDSNNQEINPFNNVTLSLESRILSDNESSLYYNYVVPYERFKNSIPIGLNVYWFELFPHEFQPSGFCNTTYIKKISLEYNLKNEIITNIKDKINNDIIKDSYIENYDLTIYSLCYNILRISSGFGGLAYV